MQEMQEDRDISFSPEIQITNTTSLGLIYILFWA